MQVQFWRGKKYIEDFNKIIVLEQAADLDEHGSEDDRHDGHELDEDVDRGTGSVLERVADGIADNGAPCAASEPLPPLRRRSRCTSWRYPTRRRHWTCMMASSRTPETREPASRPPERRRAEAGCRQAAGTTTARRPGANHLAQCGLGGDGDAGAVIGLAGAVKDAGNLAGTDGGPLRSSYRRPWQTESIVRAEKSEGQHAAR